MSQKKILVIDDEDFFHEVIKEGLGDRVTILSVFSIEEAEEVFSANPDLCLIVMDACVPGDSPTTPPLVRRIRESFNGPIIATSSLDTYRRKLMEAGCDHESTKLKLPEKIIAILGL